MLWAPWRLLESPVGLMFPDGYCREVGWLGRWAGGAARPTAVRSRRYTPDLPRCAIVPRGPRNCSRLTSLRVRSDGEKKLPGGIDDGLFIVAKQKTSVGERGQR